MRTLAVMFRDGNPIHLYPEAAAEYGLGERVVNPGSANLAYVLNALATIDPDARVEHVHFRYLANVFADDEVVATVNLDEASSEGGRRRLTCNVTLDVEGGQPALQGTATVSVPEA
jgi:acyl dehydratase